MKEYSFLPDLSVFPDCGEKRRIENLAQELELNLEKYTDTKNHDEIVRLHEKSNEIWWEINTCMGALNAKTANELKNKKKWYFNATLSIIAVIISFAGIFLSSSANNISKEALRKSNENFSTVNRPQLDLICKIFKGNNKYIKIDKMENQLNVKLKFELKNIGNLTAKDIIVPREVHASTGTSSTIYSQTVPLVSLAKGSSYELLFDYVLKYNTPEEMQFAYTNFNKVDWEGIEVEIPISYSNFSNPEKKYKTLIKYQINYNNASILKSEY